MCKVLKGFLHYCIIIFFRFWIYSELCENAIICFIITFSRKQEKLFK